MAYKLDSAAWVWGSDSAQILLHVVILICKYKWPATDSTKKAPDHGAIL